jgi:dTDP-4-dehydrorhamnose reductase
VRLLVTGADGMLGHRVVAEAAARGHEVRGTDLPELDLTDVEAVRRFVDEARPEVVVNCAAYTDVDAAESAEDTALRVNRDTAANVAAAAPYVIHLSTDYVFPGDTREQGYVESDATGPKTAYGRTKLAGEDAVRAAGDQHAVVRTSWLYGEGGKNFVDTMLGLGAERDELSVVFDQVGSPTWTGHLVPALLDLAERRGRGTYHGANAGRCSWHDLAVEALDQAGIACRVRAVTTAEFPRPAPRPAFSVLGSEREDALVLPAWQDGVAGHLEERVLA